MIGGTVIGIVRTENYTLLHVEGEKEESCAISVIEKNIVTGKEVIINLDDKVWWQSGTVMWTPNLKRKLKSPKCGVHYDIRLKMK